MWLHEKEVNFQIKQLKGKSWGENPAQQEEVLSHTQVAWCIEPLTVPMFYRDPHSLWWLLSIPLLPLWAPYRFALFLESKSHIHLSKPDQHSEFPIFIPHCHINISIYIFQQHVKLNPSEKKTHNHLLKCQHSMSQQMDPSSSFAFSHTSCLVN